MPKKLNKRQLIIRIARSKTGVKERWSRGGGWINDSEFNRWYATKVGQPSFRYGAWCHMYVSWLAEQAGILGDGEGQVPLTAWCPSGLSKFRKEGRAKRGHNPNAGDIVYFIRRGRARHVGLVLKRVGNYIITSEGNTNDDGSFQGNGVYVRYRRIGRDQWYCTPDYGSGSNPVSSVWDGKHYPGRHVFRIGRRHPAITLLGKMLVAKGFGRHYRKGPGPVFGKADRANVREFQRAQGWRGRDADGYPGPETWRRLMAGVSKPAPVKPVKVVKPSGKKVVTVDLSMLNSAFRKDARARQGATSYRAGVKPVEDALAAEGLLSRKWVDGSAGTMTRKAYRKWQRKLGYRGRDADGYPGLTSLRKLGQRHGFKVIP